MENVFRKHIAKPFLKWAGGKGQLLDRFKSLYPKELINGKIKTYIEPFVGGGAVLFDILQKYDIESAVIIDLNKELINCYRCIKEGAETLIERLSVLQQKYIESTLEGQTKIFASIRRRYNRMKLNEMIDFEKAADFIFLNKTCFNGLYRVNSKGEFNVPFGKYKSPKICDVENLTATHHLLQRVTILHGEYTQCKEYIDSQTFAYFDPPYRPITETQSFVGYSQNGFNDVNQVELASFTRELSIKGAKILLSNSDPKNINPNDNFFDDLYKDFFIQRIMARRVINCQADKRGNITEIIVANYKGVA